jgi:hypothetical protein
VLGAIGAAVLGLAFGASAHAQANRTFVSTTGVDTNPCTATAPCRNFSRAIAQVADGGEVLAVDSGGYGAFSVTGKAVRVMAAPGVQAGVTVSTGTTAAIFISNAPWVVLKGLTVSTPSDIVYGILVSGVGQTTIEGLSVSGFNEGIRVLGGHAVIQDTHVLNGRGSFPTGISLAASAAADVQAVVERVRLQGVYMGLETRSSTTHRAQAVVRSSVATGNAGFGFHAYSIGEPSQLTIEDCVSSGNGYGAGATNADTLVRVANSTITHNDTGLALFGLASALLSRGDNTVEDNDTAGAFTGTFSRR